MENTDHQTNITEGLSIPTTDGNTVGKSKKTSNPPSTRGRRGQQLNINELTIGTLQVSTFEFHVEKTKQLLLSQIQSFKAGSISKCYSRWLDLTSDPEVLSTVKGQLIPWDACGSPR